MIILLDLFTLPIKKILYIVENTIIRGYNAINIFSLPLFFNFFFISRNPKKPFDSIFGLF